MRSVQSSESMRPLCEQVARQESTDPASTPALNRAFVRLLAGHLDLRSMPVARGVPGGLMLDSDRTMHRLPLIETGMLEAVVMLASGGHRVVPLWFSPGEIAMLSALCNDDLPQVDLIWRTGGGQLRWVPKREVEEAVRADLPLALALLCFMTQRPSEA